MREDIERAPMTFEEYQNLQKWQQYVNNVQHKEVPRKTNRPFTDKCKHIAVFYDNHGTYLGQKKLKYQERFFSYKGNAYNFIPEKSTWFKRVGIFTKTKYYHYNIFDAMPLVLDKKCQPLMHNDTYKAILDSDLVKKLNPKNTSLLDLIGGWKGAIVILIIGAAIYYFASGGTLTSTSP